MQRKEKNFKGKTLTIPSGMRLFHFPFFSFWKLFFYVVMGVFLISCNEIKNTKNKLVEELKEPIIADCFLFDKFPELKNDELKINEIKGIKCEYVSSFYKYYFKYSGDRELIQKYISNIQCRYAEITPDTMLIKSDFARFEQETQNGITEYEVEKASFFFEYKQTDIKELEFYTCTKTPEKHFIVFDVKNNLIYQMIKNFRE
ncbi:MAG: hypothetical protein FWH36_04495 [Lentimicrobiaceae bacterium]|nr:hypothetical protein [Lentimicrobiaceae bacterium]